MIATKTYLRILKQFFNFVCLYNVPTGYTISCFILHNKTKRKSQITMTWISFNYELGLSGSVCDILLRVTSLEQLSIAEFSGE